MKGGSKVHLERGVAHDKKRSSGYKVSGSRNISLDATINTHHPPQNVRVPGPTPFFTWLILVMANCTRYSTIYGTSAVTPTLTIGGVETDVTTPQLATITSYYGE
jgi:hypothetical protein